MTILFNECLSARFQHRSDVYKMQYIATETLKLRDKQESVEYKALTAAMDTIALVVLNLVKANE